MLTHNAFLPRKSQFDAHYWVPFSSSSAFTLRYKKRNSQVFIHSSVVFMTPSLLPEFFILTPGGRLSSFLKKGLLLISSFAGIKKEDIWCFRRDRKNRNKKGAVKTPESLKKLRCNYKRYLSPNNCLFEKKKIRGTPFFYWLLNSLLEWKDPSYQIGLLNGCEDNYGILVLLEIK